jgi:hypothetical protein
MMALFIWLIIRLIQLVFSARTVFFSHKKSANSVFQPAYNSSRTDIARSPVNKTTTATNDGPRFHALKFLCVHHLFQVGKDVILYAILRSELAVARGTVISTNPNTMVGGQCLGNEYCEVIVNVVMRRDAMLPRAYGNMETMASALKMSIAW